MNKNGFLIFVTIIALVLGGIMVFSPGKETSNKNESTSTYEKFEGFDIKGESVCKKDGKPIVYVISTTTCPHCIYIKDTFVKWGKDNSDKLDVQLWVFDGKSPDSADNLITDEIETSISNEAMQVYEKMNPDGTVPTFIFGCKYVRVGNGFEGENDLNKEVEAYNKIKEKILSE